MLTITRVDDGLLLENRRQSAVVADEDEARRVCERWGHTRLSIGMALDKLHRAETGQPPRRRWTVRKSHPPRRPGGRAASPQQPTIESADPSEPAAMPEDRPPTTQTPDTAAVRARLLALPGLGRTSADKLVDAFGAEALNSLRQDPARVRRLIGTRAFRALSRALEDGAGAERATEPPADRAAEPKQTPDPAPAAAGDGLREVEAALLARDGIGRRSVQKLLDAFGAEVLQVASDDPERIRAAAGTRVARILCPAPAAPSAPEPDSGAAARSGPTARKRKAARPSSTGSRRADRASADDPRVAEARELFARGAALLDELGAEQLAFARGPWAQLGEMARRIEQALAGKEVTL